MKNSFVIKMSYKDKKYVFFFFVILMLTLLGGTVNNNFLKFVVVTLGLIAIIVKAKISYFSFFSGILWFSFLQQYFASISPLLSTGRLRWDTSVPVYYEELYICTMFFYIIEIFLFNITNVLNNEKEIYKSKIKLGKNIVYIFSVVAFVLVLLAYPSIPLLDATLSRDEGYFSSSMIVPVSMVLLGLTVDYVKKYKTVMALWIVTLIWILFHGDRVIVFGLGIYVILKYLNDGEHNYNKLRSYIFNKKIIIVFIGACILIILGIRIQTTRVGGIYDFNLSVLFNDILKQGTASDVVHAFNCATDLWKNGNALNGYTYLQYLVNWIPFIEDKYSPSMILMDRYDTLGGGLFFSEPIMNHGLIGVFVYSILFLLILTWLFSKQTSYRTFLVVPFVILIFRFAWYASIAGIITMIEIIIPIAYIVAKRFR